MGLESAALMPMIYGSLGSAGIQGAMSAFGGSDIDDISGFAAREGDYLDPRMHAEQYMRDAYNMLGMQAAASAQPSTLPGAFVQPTPWYSGGGLPIPIGVTGQDPALFAPGVHQTRAGWNMPTPDYDQLKEWSGEYEARGGGYSKDGTVLGNTAPETTKRWLGGQYPARRDLNVLDFSPERGGHMAWGALSQPDMSGQVDVGGGVPQLKANLELMGVTTNPQTGMFETSPTPTGDTANPQLFKGSQAWNPRGGVNPSEVSSPFGGGPGLLGNYQAEQRRSGVGV
jgi:hypothetical protein